MKEIAIQYEAHEMSDYWEQYIGNERTFTSTLDPWPAIALSRTLDISSFFDGNTLPLLWHWTYFLETPLRSQIGTDGHPKRGDFLPPISLPRRLFAGARIRSHRRLELGEKSDKTERVSSIIRKEGGSGELIIVTLNVSYFQKGRICIEEQRDLVYCSVSNKPIDTKQIPFDESEDEDSIYMTPDPVLLFQFSALTFNGHRIHYDKEYAQTKENYPNLVVHGPFQAIVLAHLAERSLGAPIQNFTFRAHRPAFAGTPMKFEAKRDGSQLSVASYQSEGGPCMTGHVTIEDGTAP